MRLSNLYMLILAAALLAPGPAAAQTPAVLFEAKALAAGATQLRTSTDTIELWGVTGVEGVTARQKMQARRMLDDLIGKQAVQCEMKGRTETLIKAQCVNAKEIDLGLYMLQNGMVMADRAVIYGTAFEEPYLAAEAQAERRGEGFWAADSAAGGGADLNLIYIVLALQGVAIALIAVLTYMAFKGFRKISGGQDKNLEFLNKERELKMQERKIVASMLDAELRANKSKIEAYLMIYEEMLKSLREPGQASQYTKAGDIVQMQPALERAVFERNTDKMDLLGRKLSSEVIHFYARIKTNPDYANIEPDMPTEKAIEIVEQAVKNARTLDEILKRILETFTKAGIGPRAD